MQISIRSRTFSAGSGSSRRAASYRSSNTLRATQQQLDVKISIAQSTGKLDLSDCQLSEVPAEVFQCRDLEELSLAGNRIAHLSEDIGLLTGLKRLGLAGNLLQNLPNSISRLQLLEGLWIHGNQLEAVPDGLGDLKQLQQLSLSGNQLATLPDTISKLEQLQDLGVAGNRLVSLPSNLAPLSALKKLSLHGNQLTSVPEQLGLLPSLQELWLMGNHLVRLPCGFSGLQALKELSLADNQLEGLPQELCNLPSLEKLWLYNNRLSSVPPCIALLPSLTSVWLEANPLSAASLDGLLEAAASARGKLRTLGLDEEQAAAASDRLLAAAGSAAKVGQVAGSGSSGYFKLQKGEGGPPGVEHVLVVAFGSAPGVPNWGGLLGRAYKEAGDPASRCFDVLYVVDSARMWYNGGDEGYQEYYTRLQAVTQQYSNVIMLGDSMGATGALLFSSLATSVLAFCPQVDLTTSAIRPAQPASWLHCLEQRLVAAVVGSSATITVHCGSWQHDLDQANLLADSAPNVLVKVHHASTHRLALYLDSQRKLLPLVTTALAQAARPAVQAGVVRLSNIL